MPPEHTIFQQPPQEKIWYSKFGRPSRPSDVAETTNTVTRCCTFQRSIATDHMKWHPLIYHSPSRRPRQAIALVQYSNFKCVSRLCATLYYIKGHLFKTLCVFRTLCKLHFEKFLIFLSCTHKACGLNFCH